VRWADVGDEGLVCRPVEALAGAEEAGRNGECHEGRGRLEPRAGRVDEQPRDGPQHRHQRERAHAATALEPV